MLTDEQKKLRATAFGASEAPTLVGVGGGKLIDLYRAKAEPEAVAAEDAGDQNDLLELGHEYEDPVCRIYARRTGTFLAPVETLRHPTRPLALCTPDRARFTTAEAMKSAAFNGPVSSVEMLQGADRLVEAKSTGSRYRFDYGRAGSGDVPEEKCLQCIWQMGVTGLKVVDLPVLFMGEWGRRIEVFTVTWNEELFDWMYDAAERFWRDHVVPKKPPEPDGSDAYDDALARMFPADQTPPLVATDADDEMILDYAKFRELERRVEALKKTAGQTLRNRIGMASGIISERLGKVSWKRSRDGSEVDWEMAAQDALTLGGLCLNAFKSMRENEAVATPESIAELERRLKAIIPDATRVKSGYRRLLVTPKKGGDADFGESVMKVALPALGDGK